MPKVLPQDPVIEDVSQEVTYSNPGSKIKKMYKMKLNKENGTRELVQSGEYNLYDEIQSHKDSCDIHVILERFANGDVSALDRRQAFYADLSEMPQTYAELYQKVIDAENMFAALPLETRRKFDYSPAKFFSMIGTSEFDSIIGATSGTEVAPSPSVSAAGESEVVENE